MRSRTRTRAPEVPGTPQDLDIIRADRPRPGPGESSAVECACPLCRTQREPRHSTWCWFAAALGPTLGCSASQATGKPHPSGCELRSSSQRLCLRACGVHRQHSTRTRSGGPRRGAPVRRRWERALSEVAAHRARVPALGMCGRRIARSSSGACCSPLEPFRLVLSGRTRAARPARALRTRERPGRATGVTCRARAACPSAVTALIMPTSAPKTPR